MRPAKLPTKLREGLFRDYDSNTFDLWEGQNLTILAFGCMLKAAKETWYDIADRKSFQVRKHAS